MMEYTGKASETDALNQLYTCINHPVQAGKVWVKYNRSQIDAVLDVLKQMLQARGIEFRKSI
jgi:hypothetical protein